ncbi:hypothetical protein [Mycobacterium sp. 236(2023)]|uniref:hypothetical protein n=1 Tax=Mycobacterium sp. 236(2023) TaxID=3038163 RepID=UPI002415703D|nr:hypothetical protein [Mycobacterium sp. 236(2023)]MDG4668669.1 hypothetical protein [Mycobacterium sp. 236(2023)]
MIFDRRLNEIQIAIRSVTVVRLHASAEEVPVLTAVATGCPLDDHSSDSACLRGARATEEGALEIVMVPPTPLPGVSPCIEQILNAVE